MSCSWYSLSDHFRLIICPLKIVTLAHKIVHMVGVSRTVSLAQNSKPGVKHFSVNVHEHVIKWWWTLHWTGQDHVIRDNRCSDLFLIDRSRVNDLLQHCKMTEMTTLGLKNNSSFRMNKSRISFDFSAIRHRLFLTVPIFRLIVLVTNFYEKDITPYI